MCVGCTEKMPVVEAQRVSGEVVTVPPAEEGLGGRTVKSLGSLVQSLVHFLKDPSSGCGKGPE